MITDENLHTVQTYLAKILAGDLSGIDDLKSGLCDNLHTSTGFMLKNSYFKAYGNYSGQYSYPIKGFDGVNPILAYSHNARDSTMWSGSEYAEERLRFCKWLYNNITTEWIT